MQCRNPDQRGGVSPCFAARRSRDRSWGHPFGCRIAGLRGGTGGSLIAWGGVRFIRTPTCQEKIRRSPLIRGQHGDGSPFFLSRPAGVRPLGQGKRGSTWCDPAGLREEGLIR